MTHRGSRITSQRYSLPREAGEDWGGRARITTIAPGDAFAPLLISPRKRGERRKAGVA